MVSNTNSTVRQSPTVQETAVNLIDNLWPYKAVTLLNDAKFLQTPAAQRTKLDEGKNLIKMSPYGLMNLSPWDEFLGKFQAPDHLMDRFTSNLSAYFANYLTVFLTCLSLKTCLYGLCLAVQWVYVLVPEAWILSLNSKITTLHLFALLVALNIFIWILALYTILSGGVAIWIGLGLVALHAAFKTRTPSRLAQDYVNKQHQG
eukprot:Platyproteum_vivax@DN13955_c0_g1_i1.p1